MKKLIVIVTILMVASFGRSKAQCAFTPFITPENMILCPNTQDTLWTGVFDSYQWYKNGNIIPGATLQYLVVDHYNDAGARFSVMVSEAGCSEMSADMLVDGWAFLGVTVISGGDYQFDGNRGVHVLCDSTAIQGRDTMTLSLNMPYNTNIQWYKDNQPIPGANSSMLTITETGDYSVEGAPAVCPDYLQRLGVTISVELVMPAKPVITKDGELLKAGALGASLRDFQWYLDGQQINGANDSIFEPLEPGIYTVSASDGFCGNLSDPFEFEEEPSGLSHIDPIVDIRIYPNPASSMVHVKAPFGVSVSVNAVDGREVIGLRKAHSPVDISGLSEGWYIVNIHDWDGRILKTMKIRKQMQ